jgi:hypothetical protein
VRQAGSGIFQGHGASQADARLDGDIWSHPDAADSRPHGDMVYYQNSLQIDRGFIHLDDLGRPQLIGKAKNISHNLASLKNK